MQRTLLLHERKPKSSKKLGPCSSPYRATKASAVRSIAPRAAGVPRSACGGFAGLAWHEGDTEVIDFEVKGGHRFHGFIGSRGDIRLKQS